MSDAITPVEVDLDPDDGIITISRRGACLPLTLTEAHQVICRLTGILLGHVQSCGASSAGRAVDLAPVEQVLYRQVGVIDPRDVSALLAAITAVHTTGASPPAEPAGPEPAPPGRWS